MSEIKEWLWLQETKAVDYIEREVKAEFGRWPDGFTQSWLRRRFRWAKKPVLDRVWKRYEARDAMPDGDT